MFFPEGQVRVFLYGEPVSMRLSFDGLYALARHRMQQDPLSAAVKLVVAWMVKFMRPFCCLDLSPFDDWLSYRVDPDSSERCRRVASCA